MWLNTEPDSGECGVDPIDYSGFGNWEVRAAPSSGGNVSIDWPDGPGLRMGNVSSLNQVYTIDVRCGRPPAYWGDNHAAFSPVVGGDYSRDNNLTTGHIFRFLGPCTEEPLPHSYNHFFQRCDDTNTDLGIQVIVNDVYPVLQRAQITYNGTCYFNFFGYLDDDQIMFDGIDVLTVDKADVCNPGDSCIEPTVFD